MLKKLLSSSYVDQFLIELHGNLMYSLKLQIQTARFKSFFSTHTVQKSGKPS